MSHLLCLNSSVFLGFFLLWTSSRQTYIFSHFSASLRRKKMFHSIWSFLKAYLRPKDIESKATFREENDKALKNLLQVFVNDSSISLKRKIEITFREYEIGDFDGFSNSWHALIQAHCIEEINNAFKEIDPKYCLSFEEDDEKESAPINESKGILSSRLGERQVFAGLESFSQFSVMAATNQIPPPPSMSTRTRKALTSDLARKRYRRCESANQRSAPYVEHSSSQNTYMLRSNHCMNGNKDGHHEMEHSQLLL